MGNYYPLKFYFLLNKAISKTDKLGNSTQVFIRKGDKDCDCYHWMKLYYIEYRVKIKLFPLTQHEIRKQIRNVYKNL